MISYPVSLPCPLLSNFVVKPGKTYTKGMLFGEGRHIPVTNDTITLQFNFSVSEYNEFVTWYEDTLFQVNAFRATWGEYDDYVFKFISNMSVTKLYIDIYTVAITALVVRKHFVTPDMVFDVNTTGQFSYGLTGTISYTINDINKVTITRNAERNQYFDVVAGDTVKIYLENNVSELNFSGNDTIQNAFIYNIGTLETLDTFIQVSSTIEKITFTADLSNVVSAALAFRYNPLLREMIGFDTPNCQDFTQLFKECTSLISINTINTTSGVIFDDMFLNCTNLSYPWAQVQGWLSTPPGYDFN